MIKKVLGLVMVCACAITASAQNSYFSNNDVTVTSKVEECHYPENGIHSEYQFITITNKTANEVTVDYNLDLWYNNEKRTPDVTHYSFTIPANSSVSGSCADRKAGLSVYSKILDLPAKTGLTKFELNELKVNGTIVK